VQGSWSINYIFASRETPAFGSAAYGNDVLTITANGYNMARLADGQSVSINALTPNGNNPPYNLDFVQVCV
jgi:hypothetical protein